MSRPPRSPKKISRRDVLRLAAHAPFLGLAGWGLAGCKSLRVYPDIGSEDFGLGALAARNGKLYGAAVQSTQLNIPDFAEALKREVTLLVPETELKWGRIHPHPNQFDFSGYHRIAAFAHANDMKLRGHTLVWHWANPGWLEPALTNKTTAEKILQTHMKRVLAETAPVIRNWDVVNEALDPRSGRDDGLRETLWLKALGPDYISLAFHMAHDADPGLTLVYNDYSLEEGTGYGRAKRQACLRLLEGFKRTGVPINALGLQSHLHAGGPLGGDDFTGFLKEVRALGLDIIVTEFDLDVGKLSGHIDDKIRFAQNYVRVYLDMLQQSGPVNMLLTWGLTDRYSWLRKDNPNFAGALPLDKDYRRGKLWETLRSGWAER